MAGRHQRVRDSARDALQRHALFAAERGQENPTAGIDNGLRDGGRERIARFCAEALQCASELIAVGHNELLFCARHGDVEDTEIFALCLCPVLARNGVTCDGRIAVMDAVLCHGDSLHASAELLVEQCGRL